MLTRRDVLAGGLGGLGGLVPARPALARESVRVPIEVTDTGLPVIGAVINGRPLRFIVDTGAQINAIRHDLVAPLRLRRVGHRPGIGADGHVIVADYVAYGVILGGALHEARLPLSAIPGLTTYDGLLSGELLTACPSVLDYGAREIRLYPAGRLDLTGYSMIPSKVVRPGLDLAPRFHCPLSIDGLPLSAMLDTGFETEVFLNAGIVRRHGLWNRFPVREAKTFRGMAGKRLVTRVVDMPNLRLGDIERTSVRVTLADPAGHGMPAISADVGIIGASLLKHFAIAFAGGDRLGLRPV